MPKITKRFLKNLLPRRKLKFHGYDEGRLVCPAVEKLPDDELARLNELLPWMCFTVDSRGRRFGDLAWSDKRSAPQTIPDGRIERLHALFDLQGRSVLEIGCFEGIHTIALARHAKAVHAIDSRIENVVKTLVRANLFGCKPDVSLCDIEDFAQFGQLPVVDVIHHVGVLYHLKDPGSHLLALKDRATRGLLLDTHYATPEMASATHQSAGRALRYFKYEEGGRNEVFSGMYDHAKWLLLDDIKALLAEAGFTDIRVMTDEVQRNGPRVTLYAARASMMAPALA